LKKKNLLKLHKTDRKPTSKLKRVSKCAEIFREKITFQNLVNIKKERNKLATQKVFLFFKLENLESHLRKKPLITPPLTYENICKLPDLKR